MATFTDPDSLAQALEYSASVDWGDGSAPSAGAITGPIGGPFTVSGSHTYGEEGSYSVTVTVTDIDTANNSSVAVTHATVADAALAAVGVNGNAINSASTTVATFTDADPGGTVSDYTASIDWGDGSTATAGTVSAAGTGFAVAGTHTYPATGPFSFVVKTHVCDGGGACADARSTLSVQYMTGRAYGISLTAPLVAPAPTPDTGAVARTSPYAASVPCVLPVVTAVLTAPTLCAGVTVSTGPGASKATAPVHDATVGLPLLPAVVVQAVQASSQTTCAGSTGSTTIAYLKIGGTVVAGTPIQPAPNTALPLLGLKVVLNEQVPIAGGLTVNAVHVTGPGVDLVVSSATSDIHNCP